MTVDRRIIDLYNEYVHTALPRREFMTRLVSIAGGSAAAMAVLPFGFHNDSSAARYNEPAAKLAWSRTLDFFDTYLKSQ